MADGGLSGDDSVHPPSTDCLTARNSFYPFAGSDTEFERQGSGVTSLCSRHSRSGDQQLNEIAEVIEARYEALLRVPAMFASTVEATDRRLFGAVPFNRSSILAPARHRRRSGTL